MSKNLGVLQTFVGSKKTVRWLWTAVNHSTPGIIAWVLGNRRAKTFKPLWQMVYYTAWLLLRHRWADAVSVSRTVQSLSELY